MVIEKGSTKRFQSTLPMKGATSTPAQLLLTFPVSIHAPNEGSDIIYNGHKCPTNSFNPRSQ